MAEMKIIIQKIERIESHDNADRLEIAFTDTFDWPVIIGKDNFKVGDSVIHFPVDCVIPEDLEELLLGGSKLKLKGGRIRAAKIRGVVSYGILAPIDVIASKYKIVGIDKDLMSVLGCKKYEPPVKSANTQTQGKKTKKRLNTNFTKYFDMNHLQNCKGIFNDDDVVIVTEKLHGTSFRAGWVKRDTTTLWDKVKLFIKRLYDKEAEWEFVYGSRNVQLQTKVFVKTFYETNVYAKMVKKYNLKKLPKNLVIYAEIVGPGIQKNYQYTEDHDMFVYDVKMNGNYVDYDVRTNVVEHYGLKNVPRICYMQIFEDLNLKDLTNHKSYFNIGKFPIEGVVIETIKEEICKFGRKKVKLLNSEYLLNKTNTDNH